MIPGGGSVSFGFNGSWDGANGVPTAFALNDVACGDYGPGPDPDPDPEPDPEPGDGRQMEDLDRGLVSLRTAATRLWRIDLGRNIRAGAHQLSLADTDGDGRDEVGVHLAPTAHRHQRAAAQSSPE